MRILEFDYGFDKRTDSICFLWSLDNNSQLHNLLLIRRSFWPIISYPILSPGLSLYYFIPILINYLYTGYVLRIPTLIVAAVTFLTAVMIFLSGLILQVLKKQHDQNFEHYLTQIRQMKNKGFVKLKIFSDIKRKNRVLNLI